MPSISGRRLVKIFGSGEAETRAAARRLPGPDARGADLDHGAVRLRQDDAAGRPVRTPAADRAGRSCSAVVTCTPCPPRIAGSSAGGTWASSFRVSPVPDPHRARTAGDGAALGRGAPGGRGGPAHPGMLEVLNLTRKAELFPQQLSGGEQQRVAIGRALIKKPGPGLRRRTDQRPGLGPRQAGDGDPEPWRPTKSPATVLVVDPRSAAHAVRRPHPSHGGRRSEGRAKHRSPIRRRRSSHSRPEPGRGVGANHEANNAVTRSGCRAGGAGRPWPGHSSGRRCRWIRR